MIKKALNFNRLTLYLQLINTKNIHHTGAFYMDYNHLVNTTTTTTTLAIQSNFLSKGNTFHFQVFYFLIENFNKQTIIIETRSKINRTMCSVLIFAPQIRSYLQIIIINSVATLMIKLMYGDEVYTEYVIVSCIYIYYLIRYG